MWNLCINLKKVFHLSLVSIWLNHKIIENNYKMRNNRKKEFASKNIEKKKRREIILVIKVLKK